jgi:hypothetical protein
VGATVVRGTIDLAINGAAGIDFLFKPFNLDVPIDIESVVITFQSGAAVPDAGTFGGISALSNGISEGDFIQCHIRDDLSALDAMYVSVLGQYTLGE